jgi:lipoprotein-releasing system ATP-binding protein
MNNVDMNTEVKKIILSAKNLSKIYRSGPDDIIVWEDINLTIHEGETISIIGASGSGKSTLLNVLSGLDSFESGEVQLAGKSLANLNDKERTKLRNQDIGFVYQFHHLLPEFTSIENVMMPLLLKNMPKKQAYKKALECLSLVKLEHRIAHKPAELSGGERQRVAIARAVVNTPKIVFLDEPTGNLDQSIAESIESMLMSLTKVNGTAFVLVTHDIELASRVDTQYQLIQGKLNLLN